MSQSQFGSLDENLRHSFLEKRLWIKENYEVRSISALLFAVLCLRVFLLHIQILVRINGNRRNPTEFSDLAGAGLTDCTNP